MAGVAIQITPLDLDAVVGRLREIHGRIDMGEMVQMTAGIVESQTRRRISEDKSAPDGTPWADWSPAYAETRHGGQSLLQGRGDLLDSIFGVVSGALAEVGTNMVYGAAQQLGTESQGGGIPARPFLGVSDDNFGEIEDVLGDYFEGLAA